MKYPITIFAVMLALWLCACHAHPAAPQDSGSVQTSAPTHMKPVKTSQALDSQKDPAKLLNAGLHKGMAYSEFRKAVLDRGWQPKPDAQCMANVVGGNYQKLCSAHPELSDCRVCQEVPELSSCSADGHCLMQFSHDQSNKTLQVGTYGEIGDWNAPADKSRLSVTGWEYAAPTPH